LSVGSEAGSSTGSQARLIQSSHPPATYHPVLMKDLGKTLTPVENKPIAADFHQFQEDQTESAMDSHLQDLILKASLNQNGDIRDVAKYMANLKKKHMESLEDKLTINEMTHTVIDDKLNVVDKDENVETSPTPKYHDKPDKDSFNTDKRSSLSPITITDKKVDKAFVGDSKRTPERVCVSPQTTPKSLVKVVRPSRSYIENSKSPDRSRSTGSSPVRLFYVKKPETDSSISKKNAEPLANGRKLSESGILKRNLSPKPNNLETHHMKSGILKRSTSPGCCKSPEPSRMSSPNNRTPECSRRASKSESQSPDRSNKKSKHFENINTQLIDFGSNQSLVMKLKKKRSDSKSPDRRSSSASASVNYHSNRSFETDTCYANLLTSQDMPYSHTSSPNSYYRQKSKSLDRKNDVTQMDDDVLLDYYHHCGPIQTYSTESTANPYNLSYAQTNQQLVYNMIENPTCVECILQNQRPPKQKTKGRQSRTRKKLPREFKNGRPSVGKSDSRSRESIDFADSYEINV
jgi:hypothetical protein